MGIVKNSAVAKLDGQGALRTGIAENSVPAK